MNTTKNTASQPPALWSDMSAADFDASAPLTLFDLTATDNSMHLRKPDRCGTPDLFADWA